MVGARAVLQRSSPKKQSGGCAYPEQACAQFHSEAVERVCLPWSGVRDEAVGQVCLPWSGAQCCNQAVQRVCLRARSAITRHASRCAYPGQACAPCKNEAVGRACLPWSGVRAVL